ncbi:MAG TPA: hypothetical protein VEH50_13875 [Methylomirabilota bacterium]|jgi:hypothetical protein|nr:hypothetical protein [Methylomirabilota bacterium]
MSDRKICGFLLIVIVLCLPVVQTAVTVHERPNLTPQNTQVQPDSTPSSPLEYLASSWPAEVTLKDKGHLLEICLATAFPGFPTRP